MYAAKAECRGRFRFYEQKLYERIQQRLDMEQEMLRAIESRNGLTSATLPSRKVIISNTGITMRRPVFTDR